MANDLGTVLITGASGFVAAHLVKLIKAQHPESLIVGTVRARSSTRFLWGLVGPIELREMNLEDSASVREVIKAVQPQHVFHLAAQSYVQASFKAPHQTLLTNAEGTRLLLDSLQIHAPDARTLLAGSSEEYGMVYPEETPITEENPLRPLSPYAMSKVMTELWGLYYHRVYGMNVIVTRAFNHSGPGRTKPFAESDWARQAVLIRYGQQEPYIDVGNLTPQRDYTDARDTVKAYLSVLLKGEPGQVYNVASGKTYAMADILNMIIDLSGIKAEIRVDQTRFRVADVPLLLGDSTKLYNCTGWKPEIPLETTLRDLIAYWDREENYV